MQYSLASARQKLVPLFRRQSQVIGNPFRDVSDAGVACGGQAQDGKHEALVVGDHDRLNSCAG